MPTVTSAILSVVTAYEPANTGDGRALATVALSDMRQWALLTSLSWSELFDAYNHFNVANGRDAWTKRTDTVELYPAPAELTKWGFGGPYTYTGDTTTTLAFDPTSPATILRTLAVSLFAFNSWNPWPGDTNGLLTDILNVFGAYVDFTFDDGSTARAWATTATVIPAGRSGFAPAGTPTDVIHSARAIDQDLTSYASVRDTERVIFALSPLWAPPILVLDFAMHADCDSPPPGTLGEPYSHTFVAHGGVAPYTWTITAGSLPPGLTLDPATGQVTGIPMVSGTYVYTVQATDALGVSVAVGCSIRINGRIGWLDIWVWRVLTHFAAVDQAIEFPPGYERAMRLQLAADFGRQFPGHDRTRIKAQLARALEALDKENVTQGQAVEDLPESAA